LVRRGAGRPVDTLETDQGHLQIAGGAQEVHDARQLAVGNRLVGAQKNALVTVGRGRSIECRGQLPGRNGIAAERQRQIALDRQEQRLLGSGLRLGGRYRQIDGNVHG